MNSAYANSLFILGKEENLLEIFYEEFLVLEELYKDDQIREFIDNRFVDTSYKEKIIDDCFKEFNVYFKNFLYILNKDNHLDLIFEIKKEYVELYYKEKGIENGYVYGVSLSKENLRKLELAFSKKLDKQVKLEFIVDSDLIGGYRVEIANKVYDTSYKNQLKILAQDLKKEA